MGTYPYITNFHSMDMYPKFNIGLNRPIDTLISDSDKHIKQTNTLMMGYDYLQAKAVSF